MEFLESTRGGDVCLHKGFAISRPNFSNVKKSIALFGNVGRRKSTNAEPQTKCVKLANRLSGKVSGCHNEADKMKYLRAVSYPIDLNWSVSIDPFI